MNGRRDKRSTIKPSPTEGREYIPTCSKCGRLVPFDNARIEGQCLSCWNAKFPARTTR